MSVINKMLRDLDRRHAPQSGAAHRLDQSLHRGTVSLPDLARPSPRWPMRLAAGVLLAGAALAVWWWMHRAPSFATLPAPLPVQASAQVSAAMPAPVAQQAAAPVAPFSAATPALTALSSASAAAAPASAARSVALMAAVPASAPASVAVPGKSQGGAAISSAAASGAAGAGAPASRAQPAALAPTPTPAPAPAPAAALHAPMAAATASAPVRPATPGTGNAAASPGTSPVAATQRQQQAWRDALAQAQALWAAGSPDAAMDLLQQAVAVAQQVVAGSPQPQSSQMLSTLVREYARMLLAQGQVLPAFDLLVRLEVPLGHDPDIWALRANAAQRLGRHRECVDAYAQALQSRPGEQRWLLGSAVSLAALGDIAGANEMAARARAIGPVSADVQTYLRQAGVQVGDR